MRLYSPKWPKGAKGEPKGPLGVILEALGLTLETLGFTLEALGLTLEAWGFILELFRRPGAPVSRQKHPMDHKRPPSTDFDSIFASFSLILAPSGIIFGTFSKKSVQCVEMCILARGLGERGIF